MHFWYLAVTKSCNKTKAVGSYLWQMCKSEPALRVRADALLLLKQFMHVLHTHSLFVCVCACMCMTVYIQDLIRTSMYSHYHHTHIHIYNHHHIVWYKVVVVVHGLDVPLCVATVVLVHTRVHVGCGI